MKKIISKILTCFLITSFCFAKVEYSTQEELKKIEQEMQKCLDNPDPTYYGMLQCVLNATNKYNAEIEKSLKGLKKVLSDEQYQQLLKSQRQWEEFYKQDNLMLDKIFGINYPPFMPVTISAGYKNHYAKLRAQILDEIYHSQDNYIQNINNF